MRIRVQRGGFSESMETAETIAPTVEAVGDYLRRQGLPAESIIVGHTCWYDARCGWFTHTVSVGGCAVAFTDELFSGARLIHEPRLTEAEAR